MNSLHYIVLHCITFYLIVNLHCIFAFVGILTEGIFRISGAKSRIKQIREHFDKGLPIAWGDDINPHDVACLLKEYLRCLPEPLISRELYSYFLQTQST